MVEFSKNVTSRTVNGAILGIFPRLVDVLLDAGGQNWLSLIAMTCCLPWN